MVLYNDALWLYHDPNWIEVGGAVDPAGLPARGRKLHHQLMIQLTSATFGTTTAKLN